MTMHIEPKKKHQQNWSKICPDGKRSEHMKAGGREMLPVKLSEQMGIWLQLQSFPMPNGQYPVIHLKL